MRRPRATFPSLLRAELRRARWWLISIAVNLVFYGALTVLTALPAPESRRVVSLTVPAWFTLDDESVDVIEEEIAPEIFEREPVLVEEEVIEGVLFEDQDDDGSVGLGKRDFLSDAPFDGPSTSAAIGVGGGAGGGYACRGGHPKATAGFDTWRRSSLVPNTTMLRVGDKETLPLVRMNATVRIDGHRARVILDCFYTNAIGDRLEGTFRLRLPEGATPFAFAFGETRAGVPLPAAGFPTSDDELTADGMMQARTNRGHSLRPARMARRERAARAYKATVRKRVDPALVEWCGGGVFSARVFPLRMNQTHHIVIGYEMDLIQAGGDQVLVLDLPGADPALPRNVVLDAPAIPGTRAEPRADVTVVTHRARFAWNARKLPRVTVRVPSPGGILMTGRDPQAGDFFATRVTPPLPGHAAGGNERAVFVVDTSLSSNPDRMNIWLALLEAILTENRDTIREFAILYFNVERYWWQERFVPNTPVDVDAALAYARGLILQGATDLAGALAEGAAPSWANGAAPDLFLLSDGAATWGDPEMPAVAGAVFAYRTGLAGTDTRALQRVTRQAGGAVFSVVGETEVARAARAHRLRPWRLDAVTVEGGRDVLVAGRPTHLYPGQPLTIAGRGTPGADSVLTLSVSSGKERRAIRLRPDRVEDSVLTPRVYGEIAAATLEDMGSPAADEAKAFAAHFRVVGRSCSLLMLESAADFARFEVAPEQDAERVRETAVEALAEERSADIERLRADPRARLLARLCRLRDLPGVTYRMPDALAAAVGRMDRRAATIGHDRVRCRTRFRTNLPQEVEKMLRDGKPDYMALQAAADALRSKHGADDALRLVSSLVELDPGDPGAARDAAYTAMALGHPIAACHLLRRVAGIRPAEPESWRCLAMALEAAGRFDRALLAYDVAVGSRFDGNRSSTGVALAGYVRLLRRIAAGEVRSSFAELARSRLAELADRAPAPGSLVVLLGWNRDRTDVDLHVTDPAGEECNYKNRETKAGGRMTRDIRDGFGPEMFVLPVAGPGDYRVEANYYSSDRNRRSLRTRLFVTVYRDFATPREVVSHRALTLDGEKKRVEVCSFRFGEPQR